jgi:hypothetical protein
MSEYVQQSDPVLDQAMELLHAELCECHSAVMGAFRFGFENGDSRVQLESMKIASRMMQASAMAATALARLKRPGTHHTVTVREKGRDPAPENLKTNGEQ